MGQHDPRKPDTYTQHMAQSCKPEIRRPVHFNPHAVLTFNSQGCYNLCLQREDFWNHTKNVISFQPSDSHKTVQVNKLPLDLVVKIFSTNLDWQWECVSIFKIHIDSRVSVFFVKWRRENYDKYRKILLM